MASTKTDDGISGAMIKVIDGATRESAGGKAMRLWVIILRADTVSLMHIRQ